MNNKINYNNHNLFEEESSLLKVEIEDYLNMETMSFNKEVVLRRFVEKYKDGFFDVNEIKELFNDVFNNNLENGLIIENKCSYYGEEFYITKNVLNSYKKTVNNVESLLFSINSSLEVSEQKETLSKIKDELNRLHVFEVSINKDDSRTTEIIKHVNDYQKALSASMNVDDNFHHIKEARKNMIFKSVLLDELSDEQFINEIAFTDDVKVKR